MFCIIDVFQFVTTIKQLYHNRITVFKQYDNEILIKMEYLNRLC